jgi:2'-phosphotransferase
MPKDSKNNKKDNHNKEGRGHKNNGNGPPSNKKISHALSWALRHQALNLGLTITPDGYVPVQEILESTHPKLKGTNLGAIQECVETSDKQRFKLEHRPRHIYSGGDETQEKILCIRANQGHSISIIDPNLLLTKLSPEALKAIPCIVHGTYAEPWKLISEQGLKKMNRTHIHFASGLPAEDGVISGMRLSCTIYIFVYVEKCANDGVEFFLSDNGVILTAGVLTPEYFSHVTNSKGEVLLDNRVTQEEKSGS